MYMFSTHIYLEMTMSQLQQSMTDEIIAVDTFDTMHFCSYRNDDEIDMLNYYILLEKNTVLYCLNKVMKMWKWFCMYLV